MLIESIELKGIASLDEARVELPRTGVVLVTGANGSGKSTLIQGVAIALWGRTQGRNNGNLWRDGEAGLASVKADGCTYTRTRSAKGRAKLTWDDAPAHERTTDAQQQVEATVGPADRWAAIYLLDQTGAFASGTDADRKRLLEACVGMERIDRAAVMSNENARAQANAAALASSTAAGATSARAEAEGMLTRWGDIAPVVATTAADVPALQAALQAADTEARTASSRWQAAANEVRSGNARVASLEATVARMRLGTCPTCGQSVGEQERAQHEQELASAKAAWDGVEATAREEKLRKAAAELAAEREALQGVYSTAHEAQKHAAELNRQQAALAQARSRVEELRVAEQTALAALQTARATQEAATLAAAALAPRGARAALLEQTCSWLTAAASRWIAVGFEGVGVEITASRPGAKAGEVVQAITVSITRRGAVSPSPSRGELRRADLAITLALAELWERATGREPGTLFLDEVLDVLDPVGVEGCARIVAEAARERCILLVAHAAAPVVAGVAAQHLQINDLLQIVRLR